MEGFDRAGFANMLYDRLPNEIAGISVAWIKRYVTRERFAEMVEMVYLQVQAFLDMHHNSFDEAFEYWKRENGVE
jgi:hypothetical protein